MSDSQDIYFQIQFIVHINAGYSIFRKSECIFQAAHDKLQLHVKVHVDDILTQEMSTLSKDS